MCFADELLTMLTATRGKASPKYYLVLLYFSGMNERSGFFLALVYFDTFVLMFIANCNISFTNIRSQTLVLFHLAELEQML